MKKVLIWSIVIILGILFVLLVLQKIKGKIETQKQLTSAKVSQAIPVEVFKTYKTSLKRELNLVGDIKPGLEVEVYSKVPGKLKKKSVQIGDKVKKEEVLAILDRDEIGLTFEQAEITSPISGQVNRIYYDLGSQIVPKDPVMNLVNLDTVKIITYVAEEDFSFIKEGIPTEITVDAYPQKSFSGRISRINPTLDPATHKIEVEIKIFNPQNLLKPGMFAQINLLLTKHSNIIKIPHQAVLLKEEKTYVFVVENGWAKRRKVELGLKDNDYAEVVKGLNVGEDVITLGNQDLKDNDSVKIVGEEAKE